MVRAEGRLRGHLAGIGRGGRDGAAEPRGPGGPGQGRPGGGPAGVPRRVRPGPGRGIRSGCCWGRRSRGCRSWCRSGTGGCWCRRLRSTGGRRCRWRLTWPRRLRRGCGCSCAGTRTCRISARCVAGAAAGFRRQRLRREPARPVRVGRQAAGRQPGRSGTGQRIHCQSPP